MRKTDTISSHKGFFNEASNFGYTLVKHNRPSRYEYYLHPLHNGYMFNGRYLYFPKRRLARMVGSSTVHQLLNFGEFVSRYLLSNKNTILF